MLQAERDKKIEEERRQELQRKIKEAQRKERQKEEEAKRKEQTARVRLFFHCHKRADEDPSTDWPWALLVMELESQHARLGYELLKRYPFAVLRTLDWM